MYDQYVKPIYIYDPKVLIDVLHTDLDTDLGRLALHPGFVLKSKRTDLFEVMEYLENNAPESTDLNY